MSSIFPTEDGLPWTFTVRGIYTTDASSMDRSTMLVRWDYVDERSPHWGRGHVGAVVSRAEDPAMAPALALAIDRGFEDGEAPTLSQDEGSFRSSVLAGASALLRTLDALAAATLALLTLVLANTIAMGARERTREYAVLRAVGFSPGQVAGLIVAEGMVLGAAGAVAGVTRRAPPARRRSGPLAGGADADVLPLLGHRPGARHRHGGRRRGAGRARRRSARLACIPALG